MAKLTAKQRRFVEEYRIDWNATQAAIRAGYSKKTARIIAAENLSKPIIQNYLQQLLEGKREQTEITVDRILEELAKMAFFDVRKLLDEDGKPLPTQDLDDSTAAAIAGLDIVDYYEVGDEGKKEFAGWVKKYKLADKKGALELLGKHLGMFTDRIQLSGEVQIDDARARLLEKINRDGG